MKILIHSANYAPELTGIGKYTGEMAEWLAERGHQVRAVTAPPYYPAWKISVGYSGRRYTREVLGGVEVWRSPLYVPSKPTGAKRIVHLASFALSSLPVMLRQIFWKPDVVFVVEPPLFCAPAAWIVARLSGGKCWLHVQDFEVDAAFSLGLLPGWLSGVTAGIERWLMRRFDSASTISEAMRLRLREKGGRSPVLFPNWADLSEMRRYPDGAEALRASLGISPDQLVCLYSGNVAEKQGLELILETAGLVPEALFLICGQGPALPGLREKARTNGLKNVRFLSLQPKEKLPALLSMADIHLVVQKRGAADLVMPSKLANILAVGGITVVTADPETELGRMAEGDAACVYRCDPEDPRVLAQAIRHLLRNEDRCDELKRKARLYAARMIAKDHVLREFERRLIALSGGERS